MKDKLTNIPNIIPINLRHFFYSGWYLLALSIIFFTSWVTNIAAIGIIFAIVVASIILIINDDILPLVPILFCVAFSLGDTSDITKYFWMLPFFAILVIAIIYHLIIFKPRKFSFGTVGIAQLIVTIAIIMGGCTCISSTRYLGALPYSLLLGLGVFVIYFLFLNYIKQNKFIEKSIFVSKTLLYMGLILAAEIITYYIRNRFGVPVEEWKAVEWIDLGWGIDNNVATLLLISAPICFYLSTKGKLPYLYMLIGTIQYLIIVLTFSRGGILFAAITAPIVAVFTVIKSKDRQDPLLFFGLLFVIAIMVFTIKFDYFKTLFGNIFADNLSSSSRVLLYKEALYQFSKHPLFGVGGGYAGTNYINHVEGVTFYWFHSTLFQVIGSYGLLGILAFGYCYYCKAKVLFVDIKKDSFFLFLGLSFLGFESYSLIDTGTFVPLPTMMIVFVLLAILEHKHYDNKYCKHSLMIEEYNCIFHKEANETE